MNGEGQPGTGGSQMMAGHPNVPLNHFHQVPSHHSNNILIPGFSASTSMGVGNEQ